MKSSKYKNHYEGTTVVLASPNAVFSYADNHENFSSHMNKSSMMMGGGMMTTTFDEKHGQEVGSHIIMGGKAFGISLYVDEVITVHNPPLEKKWETEKVNLLVIDHYEMGFNITPYQSSGSKITVFINYNSPKSARTQLLGAFLGRPYAIWCVNQMVNGVKNYFLNSRKS